MVIDESHQTVPQIGGMFEGDQSRKRTLVEYGFRLPSALDNRPLNYKELEARIGQTIYVSATPGPYELTKASGEVIEQIIRPTGLMDPEVEVHPVKGQIDHLLEQCRQRAERHERVLVTTLTKRMAEDLTEYFTEVGVRVRYLHSDIETLERIRILRDLRRGEFDVLVGINLLREGLDLPEVSLVAILDADKEGFLRSEQSLIQTIGRAARNASGKAILYADRMTDSMKRAIGETQRRRAIQEIFNRENGITPQTIVKPIEATLITASEADEIESFLSDASFIRDGYADRVVLPETIDEVSEILARANRDRVPVTVSGAGTGTVGGRVAFGGIVLATDKLNKIISIAEGHAVVEAGVILSDLQRAVDQQGLLYPPDPTERGCFIGGTIATNASGARTFKYGPTRNYIMRLTVVLASGEVLDLRRGEVRADSYGRIH